MVQNFDFASLAPVSRAEAAAARAGVAVGGVPAPAAPAAPGPALDPLDALPPAARAVLAALSDADRATLLDAVAAGAVELVAAPPAPPAPPPPRFVKPRQRRFVLDHPIEYDGRVYEAITLRRPTSAEVGLWFERLAERYVEDADGSSALPIFVDDAGEPIPDPVIEFLDGDDDERIGGAVDDFLPPRLRRYQAAMRSASTPGPGAPTDPISST